MEDDLFRLLSDVHDPSSFLAFASALLDDRLKANQLRATAEGHQGQWANQELAEFLEAAIAWAEDTGFGGQMANAGDNPWQLFAKFLWAGRGYE